MAICETTPLWFCNTWKMVLKSSRTSHKEKRVSRVIDLRESSQYVFPLPRGQKCLVLVFFIAFLLLPHEVYSAKVSEDGSCRHDLTSIATLSCVLPSGAWQPPSFTCCNALLYAIDGVPSRDESGACCLCRYMKEKKLPIELLTKYVLCEGKDSHTVAEWASIPSECDAECMKSTKVSSEIYVHDDELMEHLHDTTGKDIFNILWIIVSVSVVVGLIRYFWKCKPAATAREQGCALAGHRRYSGSSHSIAQSKRWSL